MQGYRRTRIARNENPRNSGAFRFFPTLLTVAAITAAWGYWYVSSFGNTPIAKTSFYITKGETAASVPKKLKLENGWRARLYVKYFAPEVPIQVGTYKVAEPTDLEGVFSSVLTRPDSNEITITFLPGWTVFDIDAYLADMGVIEKGDVSQMDADVITKLSKKYVFLQGKRSLEWFLYPDTYRILPGSDAPTIASVALKNFNSKIYSKNSDLGKEFYDTLILASIVEKEERSVPNKAKVAGVLKRRIDGDCSDTGRIIGADATVCYAYGITSKECTPSFIAEHVGDKTDYNTRRMGGLTPTPIANPTDDSFAAARNPEDGEACYYLHDPEGYIHFANDAAGHNRNKSSYLR